MSECQCRSCLLRRAAPDLLASARNAKKLIEIMIETGQVDPGGFVKTALDGLNEAIAKAGP